MQDGSGERNFSFISNVTFLSPGEFIHTVLVFKSNVALGNKVNQGDQRLASWKCHNVAGRNERRCEYVEGCPVFIDGKAKYW